MNNSRPQNSSWSTRFGFYFAAIGSSFGLGNLWRFPYVANDNGGGAFILLYIFLVFIVGMPLLIGELLLGKTKRKAIVQSLVSLAENNPNALWLKRLFFFVGQFSVLLCVLVLGYFAVVSGWVMHYFIQYLLGLFDSSQFNPGDILFMLRNNGWLQLVLTGIHILITITIVAKELQDGLEKWIGYLMPAFTFLLIILAFKSLSLGNATEAFRFLFYPDFSKLNIFSFAEALGHVLFTLSVGFGVMVTFGSYLRKSSQVSGAGFRVSIMDAGFSLFGGLLIFPLVLGIANTSGPDLLFQVVPQFLMTIKGGGLFGMGFFLCLYLSALGASIGLMETMVANLRESSRFNRSQSAWMVGIICLVLAVFPALSSSVLREVTYQGRGLLALMDNALINWFLPIAALLSSQIIVYYIGKKELQSEFSSKNPKSGFLTNHWVFFMRWVIPLVIVLALTLQIIGLFF